MIQFLETPPAGPDGKSRITCKKCSKQKDANREFYSNIAGLRANICKTCLTKKIDAYDESTYLWILEAFDFPYVKAEWQASIDKEYQKNPKKVNKNILGRYMGKMKLNQWKKYKWADSASLNAEYAAKDEAERAELANYEQEMKDQLESGEISQAQYDTLVSTQTQYAEMLSNTSPPEELESQARSFYDESQYIAASDLPDPAAELTHEDKIYLAMKWGRLYTPGE